MRCKKKYIAHMKKSGITLLFLFVILAHGLTQTVTDYYMSLPEHLLESYTKANKLNKLSNFTDKDKFRKSLIKIEDIKNGYIRLDNKKMRGGGYIEVKVFKKNNGSDLIVVADNTCENSCMGTLNFLTFEKGKWANVTFDYISRFHRHYDKAEITGSKYELPRWGDKVEETAWLKDGSGTKTYKYEWSGEKFIKPIFGN